MASRTIPVDPFNPGQVFACLGLMEAAEALIGPAEGGFAWDPGATDATFTLATGGDADPVAEVLDFLAKAAVVELAPEGWTPPGSEGKGGQKQTSVTDDTPSRAREVSQTFPSDTPEKMALPIRLTGDNRSSVCLGHWAEDERTGLTPFKLYSGNRSGASIARAMLQGTWTKGKKPKVVTKGIAQLLKDDPEALRTDPFRILCPMKGSFNLDPRGAWSALDAGYSPDKQDMRVLSSPVVEMLAAWGLEAVRPVPDAGHAYRYTLWHAALPTHLARPALGGVLGDLFTTRAFRFSLAMAGKNKVVTTATEDP